MISRTRVYDANNSIRKEGSLTMKFIGAKMKNRGQKTSIHRKHWACSRSNILRIHVNFSLLHSEAAESEESY